MREECFDKHESPCIRRHLLSDSVQNLGIKRRALEATMMDGFVET